MKHLYIFVENKGKVSFDLSNRSMCNQCKKLEIAFRAEGEVYNNTQEMQYPILHPLKKIVLKYMKFHYVIFSMAKLKFLDFLITIRHFVLLILVIQSAIL